MISGNLRFVNFGLTSISDVYLNLTEAVLLQIFHYVLDCNNDTILSSSDNFWSIDVGEIAKFRFFFISSLSREKLIKLDFFNGFA